MVRAQCWYRSHLDDKRVVGIVNDDIHACQAYHLVQLIAALIDVAPLGHKGSDLMSFVNNTFQHASAVVGHGAAFRERSELLGNK